ncbi:hypothetical protein ACWGCW_01145 [Streptomyces sp. NPDC054933]
MSNPDAPRLIPTGTCWCGCKKETARGSFFVRGHDKTAEAALLTAEYESSVARLLDAHKFGPHHNRFVRDAALAAGWTTCSIEGCDYVGAPASVARHEAKPHEQTGA